MTDKIKSVFLITYQCAEAGNLKNEDAELFFDVEQCTCLANDEDEARKIFESLGLSSQKDVVNSSGQGIHLYSVQTGKIISITKCY